MQPVLTPTQMAAVDAASPASLTTLIHRAGWAVAEAAVELMGGAYGRRVVVLAGKGNNGADGRAAARVLRSWGAVVTEFDAQDPGPLPAADLVIDAAVGTGLNRSYDAPALADPSTPVLAVDCPSGVDGRTGQFAGRPLEAAVTVVLGTHKTGLLLEPARFVAGELVVAGLGLDCDDTTTWLLEASDLARWPRRQQPDHKWNHAVWVIGGGPEMAGAPALNALGASRAGAGYVRLSVPEGEALAPIAAVRHDVPAAWSDAVVANADRFGALVVGSGLSTDVVSLAQVADMVRRVEVPVVLDAGALGALAKDPSLLTERAGPTVCTPHIGEFERMLGASTAALAASDRIEVVRRTAARLGAVLVLKGPTTVVADPSGEVWLSICGDQRLATAGSGDVLAGVIGAGLAMGLGGLEAAGLGAELMARASLSGRPASLVASDLPDMIGGYLDAERTAR